MKIKRNDQLKMGQLISRCIIKTRISRYLSISVYLIETDSWVVLLFFFSKIPKESLQLEIIFTEAYRIVMTSCSFSCFLSLFRLCMYVTDSLTILVGR